MKRQVFISYSSLDADWVDLMRMQVQVGWSRRLLARHEVQPGRQVNNKIQAAIKQSDALVVLLRRTGIVAYVREEVGAALGVKCTVIPHDPDVAADGSALGTLPGLEYIDPNDPDHGLRALVEWARAFAQEGIQKDQQQIEMALLCCRGPRGCPPRLRVAGKRFSLSVVGSWLGG